MRKPQRRTFADLADEFEAVALTAKPRKRTTLIDYRRRSASICGRRSARRPRAALTGAGAVRAVRGRQARRRAVAEDASATTSASRADVQDGPAVAVGVGEPARPRRAAAAADSRRRRRSRRPRSPTLLQAYRTLERTPTTTERYWFDAARRMTVVALSTGLRRGELLGLRWQDVELLERRLHVRQAFVRGEMTTPKSRAGRRTSARPGRGRGARGAVPATRYRAAESIVFCHPALGTPLDPSKLTRTRGRRSQGRRGRRSRSGRGTASGTRRSPRRPRQACRRCSCRRRPATRRARRRSGTCTRTKRATPTPPSSPRRGCSAVAPVPNSVPSWALLAGALSFWLLCRVSQLPGLDSNQQPSG